MRHPLEIKYIIMIIYNYYYYFILVNNRVLRFAEMMEKNLSLEI